MEKPGIGGRGNKHFSAACQKHWYSARRGGGTPALLCELIARTFNPRNPGGNPDKAAL